MKSYNDYYYGYDDENGKRQKGYEERIAELIQKYPLGVDILGESAKKDFIVSFGNILRLRNILYHRSICHCIHLSFLLDYIPEATSYSASSVSSASMTAEDLTTAKMFCFWASFWASAAKNAL